MTRSSRAMMDAKVCETGSPRSETDVGRCVVSRRDSTLVRAVMLYARVSEMGRWPTRCGWDGMSWAIRECRPKRERWSEGSKDTTKSRKYIPDLSGSRQHYKSPYSTQFDTYEGAHGGQELALHGLAFGEAAADLNEGRASVGEFP